MTNEEKLKIFHKRTSLPEGTFLPIHLSMLTIANYIRKMKENTIIIEGPIEITNRGKDAGALCEELDWKPTNEEIVMFCQDDTVIQPEYKEQFVLMLKEMRDNQSEFLDKAKKTLNN